MAKESKYRCRLRFSAEVFADQLLIVFASTVDADSTYEIINEDAPTEKISGSLTLKQGVNTIRFPKRLRGRGFIININIGDLAGTKDYTYDAYFLYDILERASGGTKV